MKFLKRDKVMVGDSWFVKLNNALALSEIKILELTERTVKFKNRSGNGWTISDNRMCVSDIEFIEKVENNEY